MISSRFQPHVNDLLPYALRHVITFGLPVLRVFEVSQVTEFQGNVNIPFRDCGPVQTRPRANRNLSNASNLSRGPHGHLGDQFVQPSQVPTVATKSKLGTLSKKRFAGAECPRSGQVLPSTIRCVVLVARSSGSVDTSLKGPHGGQIYTLGLLWHIYKED